MTGMSKTKRKPILTALPDTCWIETGATPARTNATDQIGEHIAQLEETNAVSIEPVINDDTLTYAPGRRGVTFRARYECVCEGVEAARITAELHLEVSTSIDPLTELMGPPVAWTIVACADRPWHTTCAPPSLYLLPDLNDLVWDRVAATQPTGQMRRTLGNVFDVPPEKMNQMRGVLRDLRKIQSLTTVLFHDDRLDSGQVIGSLLRSVTKRNILSIVLITVRGASSREVVNKALREMEVSLPQRGALVLPHRPLRAGTTLSALALPTGHLTPDDAADAIVQGVLHYIACTPWVAPAHRDWLRRVMDLAEEANRPAPDHGALLDDLAAQLDTMKQARLHDQQHMKEMSRQMEEHMASCPGTGEAMDQLRQQAADALAQRDAAWAQLDEAVAESEDLARKLSWMRQQLARDADTTAPRDTEQPELRLASWDEVAQAAQGLKFVQLGAGALDATAALDGVQAEGWMRRTWDALMALEAYAQAKHTATAHGQQAGPHLASFGLYLRDPQSPVVIPTTRHKAGEAQTVRTNTKMSRTRVFPVPVEVDPAGEVMMVEHIRIGSGAHPAPRLHFYDATDITGVVVVGYVGPHLPNTQTN